MATRTAHIALPERYRALHHIANGGMAAVWAAEDSILGRTVAIKLLAPHFLDDPGAVSRFEREARAAATLSNHPNVVTIYDVGEHEERPFIVMEYMSGGSVDHALRKGRPERAEALRWLHEAAAALDVAHERGVVHRDVKPGNLLLDERRRLAVADFGIARLAQETSVTSSGQILGTAAYISPEQAEGREATAASDRYALAVVAYELLSGLRPFRAANFAAQARQHVEEAPPPPPELPPAAAAALARGLAKAPEERWPTATGFVDTLTEAVEEQPDPAAPPTEPTRRLPPPRRRPPPEPLPPPRPRRRRDRRLLALAGLLALALVGAIALAAGGGGGDSEPSPAAPQKPDPGAKPKPKPTSSAPAPAPAAPADSGAGASALNDQGFALLNQGRYSEAIPVLQQAVRRCGDSDEIVCAYALYNLGHALRLAGRPAEAIPYLERRLAWDNQRETVQRELDLARAQAGQGAAPSGGDEGEKGGGKGPGKGQKKGRD